MVGKIGPRLFFERNSAQSPARALSVRILNNCSMGLQTKISFRACGAYLHGTKELFPNTQLLSARVFNASSIQDITFPPIRLQRSRRSNNGAEKIISQIEAFLETGDLNKIKGLYLDVTILPPIEQMISEKVPIINLPVNGLGTIPGHYKYYTKHDTFQKIMNSSTIMARGYNGRTQRVCLTTRCLTTEETWYELFIANPLYINKGDYVIGFDLRPGAGIVEERNNGSIPEYWFRHDIRFGRNADLRFAGLNPMDQII